MQASHRNEKADLKINFVDFNVFSRISLVNVSRILVLHLLTGFENAHIINRTSQFSTVYTINQDEHKG